MPRVLDPFRFVLIAVAAWMNQDQLEIDLSGDFCTSWIETETERTWKMPRKTFTPEQIVGEGS